MQVRDIKSSSRRLVRVAACVAVVFPTVWLAPGAASAGTATATGRPDAAEGAPSTPPAAAPGGQDCEQLVANMSLTAGQDAPVQILSATVVAASGSTPTYCDVTGQIASRIRFEVRAPLTTWNGRYVQVGGGGFCGTIPTQQGSGDTYLNRGAAVASDDTGHVSSPLDADWGYNNEQAQIDWAYLAEHLTSNAAKAVIRALYGQPAAHSYFIGCSTGGRQALMEAQRYPQDFDGIVAGAPANRQNYLAPLSQGYRERVNHTSQQTLILRQPDAQVLQNAVLAKCDAADGVTDGVVADPRTCAFDVNTLLCTATNTSNCLTADKIAVIRKWYDDPRNSARTSLYPGGLPLGSEGGWAVNDIAADGPGFSAGGQFADQVLRFLAFPQDPPPSYSLYDFNYDTDPPKLATLAAQYNSDNPDMSAFRDRGGKLMLWHGFADPLITPLATIDYYEAGLSAMGGLEAVQQWYRFFLLPGVYHCSGGPGPGQVDMYSAIVTWVENAQAPAKLIASKRDSTGAVTLTRPIYPYPLEARYSGSGDPNLAANFEPVEGPRGRQTALVGLGASQAPSPTVPEAPVTVLLPLLGVGLAGTVLRRRWRRGAGAHNGDPAL